MANEKNLVPFKKGDARINRSGRPKNFDALRELAQELGYEPVDFRTDPKARSVIEAILRDWMTSKNFQKQQAFMHYAFGKVPETFEVTQEQNKIIVTWLGTGEPNSNEFGTVSGGLWPQPDEEEDEWSQPDGSSSNELDTAQGDGRSRLDEPNSNEFGTLSGDEWSHRSSDADGIEG